jgi:hypothetical protein
MSVPRHADADDATRADVERGEESGRAVPFVVVRIPVMVSVDSGGR